MVSEFVLFHQFACPKMHKYDVLKKLSGKKESFYKVGNI